MRHAIDKRFLVRILGRTYVAAMATVLHGCSPGPSSALSSTLTAAALPPADTVTANSPPTTVYATVAQKALSCWMGPKGPLKASHIFHAEAASPTTGGHAEIALHERDSTQPHPWGARAFRIEFAAEGGGTDTRVSMHNIKLPKDLADALRADVTNWTQGRDGCQAQVVRPPAPDPVPVQPVAKSKSKSTPKAKAG